MNYASIYTIALEALNVEKLRVNIVANNIANQHSLGNTFKPSQVVTTAKPFSSYLERDELGIQSVDIRSQNVVPDKVYQPAHPAADKKGYVTYPGVNTIDEMTTLLRASRAYEANIKVINTAHSLYLQSLSIGEER